MVLPCWFDLKDVCSISIPLYWYPLEPTSVILLEIVFVRDLLVHTCLHPLMSCEIGFIVISLFYCWYHFLYINETTKVIFFTVFMCVVTILYWLTIVWHLEHWTHVCLAIVAFGLISFTYLLDHIVILHTSCHYIDSILDSYISCSSKFILSRVVWISLCICCTFVLLSFHLVSIEKSVEPVHYGGLST